ncbi:MAG TPA: hypothetical protein VHA10_00780, partial [Hypericibacter adhaerens]|uniref:hypothetical protein n=1 Tax=Hypericibacter adhaerens TaxID=2602016 RepID=UPI002CA7006A
MAQTTVGTNTGAASTTVVSSASHSNEAQAAHPDAAVNMAAASEAAVSEAVSTGSAEAGANGASGNGSVPGAVQVAAATGVDSPSPDQVTIIRVVAGQPIDLPIDPQQLADAQLQIVGGDLE